MDKAVSRPLAETYSVCNWCGSVYACECAAGLEAFSRERDNRYMQRHWTPQADCSVISKSLRFHSCEKNRFGALEEQTTDSEATERCSLSEEGCSDCEDDVECSSEISPVSHVSDIRGNWRLNRIEGDMDALMLDAGINWSLRTVAKQFNYGAGILKTNITQQGASSVTIEYRGGVGVYRSELHVGTGPHDTVAEDGGSVSLTSTWHDGCLCVEGTKNKGGARIPSTSWFVVEGELIHHIVTADGLTVQRIFKAVERPEGALVVESTCKQSAHASTKRRSKHQAVNADDESEVSLEHEGNFTLHSDTQSVGRSSSLSTIASLQDDQCEQLPDLTGRWVLQRVEGNMEAVMEDAGVSYALQCIAGHMQYGAGIVQQMIFQNGASITIDYFGQGISVNRMQLECSCLMGGEDCRPYQTVGEDGEAVMASGRWEGQSLRIEGSKVSDGSSLQTCLRYMLGAELVQETVTSTGQSVKRYFART